MDLIRFETTQQTLREGTDWGGGEVRGLTGQVLKVAPPSFGHLQCFLVPAVINRGRCVERLNQPLVENSYWLTGGWIHTSAGRMPPCDWNRLYPVSLKSRETSQIKVPA